jgi:hypothetical protein
VTAEEIAAEVVSQQGWLVVGSSKEFAVGEFIRSPFTHMERGERIFVVLRVIATASIGEFIEQGKLARTMSGMEQTGIPDWPYYYRTVPED